MSKLLASSNTEKGILECIAAYWCSPPAAYSLRDGNIFSESAQKIVSGVRVVKKGKRFRFERISPEGE